MGYSTPCRAYLVFNSITKKIIEIINVIIDDFSDQPSNVESQSLLWESNNHDTQNKASADDEMQEKQHVTTPTTTTRTTQDTAR